MSEHTTPSLLVGIGASAGGLGAMKVLIKKIPADSRMAFIVIQHLDPTHKSLFSQLLNPLTELQVKEAEHGDPIRGGTVYVIPPGADLDVSDGYIRIGERQHSSSGRISIDHSFKSIAESYGSRSAGIVLSGTGSDGTEGLKAIAAAGGLALVQQPGTAEYANMPQSAINAGVVDHIADLDALVGLLVEFVEGGYAVERETTLEAALLDKVHEILVQTQGFSLEEYKTSTLQRRIARRMSLSCSETPQSYLDLLTGDEAERRLLCEDLLINVTDFFRDPEAFQSLEASVIEQILGNVGKQGEIRVWVAGCSTGEEAYSIAVLLLEALEKANQHNPIKIFATDLDEQTINEARRGVFLKSIAERVPSNLLKKYFCFDEKRQEYRIKARVRSLISFAVQNVASDPPFGRMHLISCRNLLIYLKKEIQDRVLSSFYFSLEPHGYLFLGTSESLGDSKNLFKTISKKWRIFQKYEQRQANPLWLMNRKKKESKQSANVSRNSSAQRESPSRAQVFEGALLDAFLPPSAVVGREGNILYNHGDWSPYISIATGSPTNNIVELVVPPLRSRLRSALFKALKNGAPVSFNFSLKNESVPETQITVSPLKDLKEEEQACAGIVFSPISVNRGSDNQPLTRDDESSAKHSIERELMETREELQNTVEELETSSEELKASHEEALSTNEELQSANEELEASSEELRSLNEELNTVNAQLQEKISQLQKANDDVENFFSSTEVPTIFLNPSLEVERYTPAAQRLLKFGSSDVGRSIETFRSDLIDDDLAADCERVINDFQPVSVEKRTSDGRYFTRRISPYRTSDRKIDGVVVVFQDITELRDLTDRAEIREKQQAVVASLGMLALSNNDPKMLMRQAVRQVTHTLNADFCKILRLDAEKKHFVFEEGVGWQDYITEGSVVPAGLDSQAGFTLLAKEPVMVKNLQREKRFHGPTLLLDHQVTSGISCLINHADPPFGVIGVHTKEEREFTHDDANFLLSVANLLSSALRMQASQEEVFEREAQFRSMANSIPQLAWIADATGAIHWYNERWYNYTGSNAHEMEGWGWQKVHHPDHLDRVVRGYKEAIAAREPWEDEFPLRGKDGCYRWFLSRAEPIRNFKGEVVHWFGTNTDITGKREQAEDLRDNQYKLRLALDTNKIGFFEFYISHEQTYWDQLIKDLWGLAADEVPTQEHFRKGVHPDDREEVANAIDAASKVGSSGRYSATYRVINPKTQEISWVRATGQTLFENGKPLKMVGLVIDITDRKNLEVSLKQAVKELQATDQSKNEFLSILGHELRNPLAALSGSVDILQDAVPDQHELIHVMHHSVTTMARLLDDLLDLNRVSQNKIQLAKARLDVGQILRNTLAVTANACRKKDQKLITDIAQELYVDADAPRLEQVFSNLILNASRYTPKGGEIRVATRDLGDVIEVAISDNGVGVKPEFIDRIFDPFFQIKQKQEAASGLGIGLALVKKLVGLHGGEIFADSPGENMGSTFSVRFPHSTAEPDDGPELKAPGAIREGLKVLVIEDNENILATMPVLLENLGCEVAIASTGQEGLRKVRSFQAEAVLVDIGLPDISGHEVAKALRADGYDGLLVAVSGYSHTEIQKESREVGFNHHLAKPVTLSEIAEFLAGVS